MMALRWLHLPLHEFHLAPRHVWGGVLGIVGWRQMYTICAIITIPMGLLGLCVLPGTPDKPKKLV